jgi:predicted dithiol-disulfide oxidoreductase (DUF899 family)
LLAVAADDVRFPGESAEYREARNKLLVAEVELRVRIEATAALRRTLPLGGEIPTDYVFDEWDDAIGKVRQVRLSELFGACDSLFLYSFMFLPGEQGEPIAVPCPSCTSIIDAIDGAVRHLQGQLRFAAVAKPPIERFSAHARTRGWRHARLLSSGSNSYNTDYHSETPEGDQLPIANVFVRRAGKIHHFWSSELFGVPNAEGLHPRHVDFMWPAWAMLDRTPEGRAGWDPALDY